MPSVRKVCFDRLLPRDLMRFRPSRRVNNRVRAIAPIGKEWINGSTLKIQFLEGTASQQSLVREEAKWWTDQANLQFDFGNHPDAQIRIAFAESDWAWSYIGTECNDIPRDEPTMNLGFLDAGTAAHEFGHAIGLAHEHQSPAGGIQWNEAVVIAELAKSPNFWDEATVRHNVLEKYAADQVNGTEFDPQSIMLYFFPASWTLNGVGTEANDSLSALDKQFIASAKMYPRAGVVPIVPLDLPIDAPKPTAASIGAYGEEDLFRLVVEKGGRFIVETQGRTDVVMKLFGPDSTTTLVAQDDDSGVGLNARIKASLLPGKYFVQVRHYNETKGKGEYSVLARSA